MYVYCAQYIHCTFINIEIDWSVSVYIKPPALKQVYNHRNIHRKARIVNRICAGGGVVFVERVWAYGGIKKIF